jgi:hypothetical protein
MIDFITQPRFGMSIHRCDTVIKYEGRKQRTNRRIKHKRRKDARRVRLRGGVSDRDWLARKFEVERSIVGLTFDACTR